MNLSKVAEDVKSLMCNDLGQLRIEGDENSVTFSTIESELKVTIRKAETITMVLAGKKHVPWNGSQQFEIVAAQFKGLPEQIRFYLTTPINSIAIKLQQAVKIATRKDAARG